MFGSLFLLLICFKLPLISYIVQNAFKYKTDVDQTFNAVFQYKHQLLFIKYRIKYLNFRFVQFCRLTDCALVIQEGTHKKINIDRNRKTTRNIQQGLPFNIDDVKRQTNDPKLLAAVRKTFVENISLDLSQTSLLHYFSNEMPSKSLSYKGTDTGCWASPANLPAILPHGELLLKICYSGLHFSLFKPMYFNRIVNLLQAYRFSIQRRKQFRDNSGIQVQLPDAGLLRPTCRHYCGMASFFSKSVAQTYFYYYLNRNNVKEFLNCYWRIV